MSRISESTPTRPLSSEFQRSATEARPPGIASLFQQMPANPPCHGSENLRPGSKSGFCERRGEVRDVRDVGVVELLRVAEADPAGDHPVGEADRVGADVLAERELVLHLAVVRVVVVDGDLVVDLDAGLLGEGARASGSRRRRPRRCRRPSSPSSGSCRWTTCRPRGWACPLRRSSRPRGRARRRRRRRRRGACGDSPEPVAPGRSGHGSSGLGEGAERSRELHSGCRRVRGWVDTATLRGDFHAIMSESLISGNIRCGFSMPFAPCDDGFSRSAGRPRRSARRTARGAAPSTARPDRRGAAEGRVAHEDAVLARSAAHDDRGVLAHRAGERPVRHPRVGVPDHDADRSPRSVRAEIAARTVASARASSTNGSSPRDRSARHPCEATR